MGLQEFRASSGRVVKPREDGSLMFEDLYGYLGTQAVFDAEEFFRAKRDEELGRWRSPLFPSFVVYPKAQGWIRVVDEYTGAGYAFSRDAFAADADKYAQVADQYFEAHPEAKPWHEAEVGEIWAVTILGADHIARVIDPRSGGVSATLATHAFQALDVDRPDWVYRESPYVTAGRRIWPEDAS